MSQEQGCELLPLNAIRTETVLSRFPIHNLAKTGRIDIHIKRQNEDGKLELYWDVSYSDKHGQARQLAYKLDTLIINQRIEETGRPLPKIIRLGSLSEIANKIGIGNQHTTSVKKALLQNAFASITAKLKYKDNDGKERTLEAAFQRYSLIFTGETMPDGTKADAVYLVLNDIYREVLDTAQVRPLDYDYLKALSPAAQRWYEVVSYPMFAANKHKLISADITYSDYCMYSGQERYFEWDKVKKQLYKLHQPHLKSGYIISFSHQLTKDQHGKPDWNLKYIPGQKAKNEYKYFTTPSKGKKQKQIDLVLEDVQPLPASLAPKPVELPKPIEPELEPQPLTFEGEQLELFKTLTETFNIHEMKATDLVTSKQDQVKFQLEVFQYRDKARIKDPAGYLIRAIEGDFIAPKGYLDQKVRKEREEKEVKERTLKVTREQHERKYKKLYYQYLSERKLEIQSFYDDVFQDYLIWKEEKENSSITATSESTAKIQKRIFQMEEAQAAFFVEFFSKRQDCLVFDFWAWDERLNPDRFQC